MCEATYEASWTINNKGDTVPVHDRLHAGAQLFLNGRDLACSHLITSVQAWNPLINFLRKTNFDVEREQQMLLVQNRGATI